MNTSQTQFTTQNLTGKILGIFILVFSLFIFSHPAYALTFNLGSNSDVYFLANINSGTYTPGENISVTAYISSISPIADSAYLNATTNGKIVSIIPGGTDPNVREPIYNGYISNWRTVNISTAGSAASLFAPNAIGNYVVNFSGGVNETAPPLLTYYTQYFTCFIADTKVTLADSSIKNIQDVKIGDVVKGETSNNTVLAYHRPPKSDGKIFGFNGERLFVTEEHPFKTTDGWKSINPEKTKLENIGITVTKLEIGDTLITEFGTKTIYSIESKEVPKSTPLFNFVLSGDRTYYADGYLVHNKARCDSANFCQSNSSCINGDTPPRQTEFGTCSICVIGKTCTSPYGTVTSCNEVGGIATCSGTVSGVTPPVSGGIGYPIPAYNAGGGGGLGSCGLPITVYTDVQGITDITPGIHIWEDQSLTTPYSGFLIEQRLSPNDVYGTTYGVINSNVTNGSGVGGPWLRDVSNNVLAPC